MQHIKNIAICAAAVAFLVLAVDWLRMARQRAFECPCFNGSGCQCMAGKCGCKSDCNCDPGTGCRSIIAGK